MAKRKPKPPPDLDDKQFQMMRHAFGSDTSSPGFREHYCTEIDDPDMEVLIENGYFKGPYGKGLYGEGCGMFYLTDKSKEILSVKNGTRRKNVSVVR